MFPNEKERGSKPRSNFFLPVANVFQAAVDSFNKELYNQAEKY